MCNTLTCPVEGIDAGASPALTTDANYHPIIAYVERTVVSTVGSCATGPCQCQAAARAQHGHGSTGTGARRGDGPFGFPLCRLWPFRIIYSCTLE